MQTATTATALELFGHVRIVMGMVIGLGVTRLLLAINAPSDASPEPTG